MSQLDEYLALVERAKNLQAEAARIAEDVKDARCALILSAPCPACSAEAEAPCWFHSTRYWRGGSGGNRYFHGHRVKAAGLDPKADHSLQNLAED